MNEFPESDWQTYRKLKDRIIARFFDAMMGELQKTVADRSKESKERFWSVHDFVREQAKEAVDLFDGMSRSNALQKLAMSRRGGWLNDEEMALFSPATRERIERFLNVL